MLLSAASVVLTITLITAVAPTRDSLDHACREFTAFDRNGDGSVELERLERIENASAGESGKRVMVLVEDRLLEPIEGAPAMVPHIERLTRDLAEEGYVADAVAVRFGKSAVHQDGRYLLALRDFLREVDREARPLAGVILLGRFPDALIVRTCNWRKNERITLHKGTDGEKTYDKVPFLRRVPEAVAFRGDIVLADLDGHWEDIYTQPKSELQAVYAIYPDGVPAHGGPCADLQFGSVTFEDFFHVSDGKFEITEIFDRDGKPAGHSLSFFDRSGDHECNDDDRGRPNVIAHPDILVSRIDAGGTAMRPKESIVGVNGSRLVDENGRPQAVEFESKETMPHWRNELWEFDPLLERQLLAEYFRRNHAYRTGQVQVGWRPSSIACDLGSGFGVMKRAASDWEEIDQTLADVKNRPTLVQFMEWARYPAVLRTIRAHSDPWGSVFRKSETEALDELLGGPAWAWTPRGNQLVPSLSAACRGGKLDWFLLRSMWEYDLFAPEPSIYLHTGCHGISPPKGGVRAFDHAYYGMRQGAEAVLFFGNGLALVGRSKVFYDEPKGFAQTLAEGKTVGEAWARYFEIESQAPSWGKAGGDIGRKRSYFWAVLGDWTIRLQRNEAAEVQTQRGDPGSSTGIESVSR